MSDAEEKSTKKEVLTSKILLPIVIAIIAGVITYFAKEYFDKEKIEIVDVSIRAKKIQINLSKELTDLRTKVDRDFFYEGDVANGNSLNFNEIKRLLSNLKRRKVLNSSKIATYNNLLKQLPTMSSQQLQLKYSAYSEESADKKTDADLRKRLGDQLESYISELNIIDTTMNTFIKKFIPRVKECLNDNKTNFLVEIVVQNSGNKQGILKYKATLRLESTVINLKKYNDFSEELRKNESVNSGELLSNYMTIEARAFNGLSLEVDDYFNKPGDIIAVKKEFNIGQRKALISIYTVDEDQPLATKYADFKDDLSRNENESLTKMLDEFSKEELQNSETK
jgi:hypothetical protein